MKRSLILTAVVLATVLFSGNASSLMACLVPLPPGAVPLAIVLDEEGNGGIATRMTFADGTSTITTFEITASLDPTQPAATPGLQYHPEMLFLNATPGDVVLTNANGSVSDIIEFRGDGSIVFYSRPDDANGFDGLADNSKFPTTLTNVVLVPENYPSQDLGARYVPTQGQPGFSSFMNGAPYYFISDKPWPAGSIPEDKVLFSPFLQDTPEPSYLLLCGVGLGGLFVSRWRRRRAA